MESSEGREEEAEEAKEETLGVFSCGFLPPAGPGDFGVLHT
jgi:hypothetical protein